MSLNKSLTAPCKGCEERVLMCHDSCNKYNEFKSNKAQVSEARTAYMNRKSIAVQSVKRTKGEVWR